MPPMLDFNGAPPARPPGAQALAYARQGWPVFPCNPINKRPLIERGFLAATTNELTIKGWWAQFPHAMIGVPTGEKTGFDVFDIDTDATKGKDGLGSLASIDRDLSELMDTVVGRTASGGYHCLFKHLPGVTNARGTLPPHLDVRGEGGYIIAAGSRLADGRAYEWLNPPDENEIGDWPEWLLSLIQSRASADVFDFNGAKPAGPNAAERAGQGIPPGQWHERTRDLVARLVKEGASDETIAALAAAYTQAGYTVAQTVREFAAHARTARTKWGYQPKTLEPVHTEGQAAERAKLRILSLGELAAIKPPTWLIDGVAPEAAFIGLYGAPGAAKSFVAVDMALSIATGRDWQGHKTKKGSVLYIMGEGQAGAARRIFGWLHSKGLSAQGIPFGLVPRGVAMPTGEVDELIAAIGDAKPALIVLDTLARTFGGGDENSQKDMNAYVLGVDRLREATGAAVIVIHHTGKDEAKGARGSTAFTGAVDANILVRRSGQAVTLVNKAPFGKQKDAEEFEDIHLRSVRVEFDHQGEVTSTLVLMPDDDVVKDAERPRGREPKPAGTNQVAVLEALKKAKGEALGLMRITGMVGKDSGTVANVLAALTEKGLIQSIENGGAKQWKLN